MSRVWKYKKHGRTSSWQSASCTQKQRIYAVYSRCASCIVHRAYIQHIRKKNLSAHTKVVDLVDYTCIIFCLFHCKELHTCHYTDIIIKRLRNIFPEPLFFYFLIYEFEIMVTTGQRIAATGHIIQLLSQSKVMKL